MKRAPPWQDLRAMHSRKAICRAFRIHGARILPKPARFGCMAAICCQGGALFPSEAPSGMHEARKLPRMAARERTTAKTCHRQAPENAFRKHPAVAELPRAHRGRTLPWRRPPWNAPRRNLAAVGRWGRSSQGGFTRQVCGGGQLAQRARKADSQERLARHGCTPSLRGGSTRKADSLAGIRKATSGSHARLEGWLDTQSRQGTKKSAAPKNGAFPANYGRKPDPP